MPTPVLLPVLTLLLLSACGPVAYQISAPATLTARPGQTISVRVKTSSERPRRDPVTVTLQNLPKGITASPAVIAPEADSVTIPLSASAGVATPAHHDLTVQALSGSLRHAVTVGLNLIPPSGTRDARFGQNGKFLINKPRQDLKDTAFLGPSRVLTAGTIEGRAGLRAYTQGGKIDQTFGRGGAVFLNVPGTSAGRYDRLLPFPGGGFLAAGMVGTPTGTESGLKFTLPKFAVVSRYDQSGQPVSSFGQNGTVTLAFENNSVTVNDLDVQPDGRILLVVGAADIPYEGRGTFGQADTVVRLNADGTPDADFGQAGRVPLSSEDQFAPSGLTVTRDGKLVLAMFPRADRAGDSTLSQFVLSRLNADGSRDEGFGQGGLALLDVNGKENSGVNDLAELPGGSLLALGYAGLDGNSSAMTLARLRPDGSADPTFGQGGVVTTVIGTGTAVGSRMQIAKDGKIIVAGHYNAGLNNDGVILARYLPDGTPDKTLSYDGVLVDAVSAHPGGESLLLNGDQILIATISQPLDNAFNGDEIMASEFAAVGYWN